MNLETIEGDGVAGRDGGPLKSLAEQIGGIHFHAGRNLMAEERHEEKVELPRLADVLDAGVAEADGFSFGVGNERHLG